MNNIIESLQEAVSEMRRQNAAIHEIINRFNERGYNANPQNAFDLRKLNKELLYGRYRTEADRETDRPVDNIRRVRTD